MTPSANSDLEAFTRVTTGYYRSADPRMAALALRHLLRTLTETAPDDLGRFSSLLYLFHRIARLSAEARAGFEVVLRGFTGPHEGLVRAILEARPDRPSPDALALAIEGPEHLDLLWAEFFVTGSPDPILRIVGTLDWEDRVRRHLERWLRALSLFGRASRRQTAATLREFGLDVDLEAKRILTEADLDCLCFSIAERRILIFKHLPFVLKPEDVRILGTKGTALWSLRLNATEHARVAEICRAERSRPGGTARLRLTEPIDGRPFAL
jgi:hypothetical protein